MSPSRPRQLATFHHEQFDLDRLIDIKRSTAAGVSVVLPARNEAASIGAVIAALSVLRDRGFVDELIVIDSLSNDGTARVATEAGATVVDVRDCWPAIGAMPGKGEAMWRSLHATTGDLIAFCDADVLDAGPHYVLGLLAPMLIDPSVMLVKGFYSRPIVRADGSIAEHGGRVTELTARPFLNVARPELAQFIQPLAGEWAGRRTHLSQLPFPIGYGIEIAVLLDTYDRLGLDAMAQVDLGVRTHSRQSQQQLGVMAAEVLAAALERLGREGLDPTIAAAGAEPPQMLQFSPLDHSPIETPLRVIERPPIASLSQPTEPQESAT